jgi:phosphomannomutase
VIGHIPEKDGVLADMLVAEAIAYEGKPLSQLVQEAIAEADGPLYNNRLDLHLTEAHKNAVIQSYTQNPPSQVAGIRVKEVGRKDGIKLYLAEGSWILLRPSGTEPLVRVYIETNSPEKLGEIAKTMEAEIAQLA